MKDIELQKNIKYSNLDNKKCNLDIYKPKKSNEKLPVIFVIHGGGFVAGDKKYRKELCAWLSYNTNAACVCVNHGLGPKVLFHDAIKQLQEAVNWIYDNKDEQNFDIEKLIVTGDSAGGFFAAELCAIQESNYLQEKLNCYPKCKFKGIMLDCGIYDINKALSTKVLFNLTGKVCKSFLGYNVKNIKEYEYYDCLSPINYITSTFPKTCVVYSENDFFCGGQGESLVEKLKENNVDVDFYGSKKYADNHTFQLCWTSKAAKEANELFLNFAKSCFK